MSSDDRRSAAQGQDSGVPPDAGAGAPATPDRPGQPAPATSQPAPQPPATDDDPLRGSRTSGVWIATAGVGLLLVLLVIFIVQNTQQVDIAFLVWDGQLPMAAAILVAAAAGILITTFAGGLRIIQLRRRVKRGAKEQKAEQKAAAKAAKAGKKG